MNMNYLVMVMALVLGGCSTVVSQTEIDQLSQIQKDSFYASTQPQLLPSVQTGTGQSLVVSVQSGKVLVGSDFEKLSGGKLVISEGRCDAMMLKSKHHARVLKVCFDHDKIRFGTGLHVRKMKIQHVLKHGLHIDNFLTDEDDGIYSLNMQLRLS
jgi:uncharacterized protein YceK